MPLRRRVPGVSRAFARTTFDENQYVDETGTFYIERAWYDGPRGGKRSVWNLWERGEHSMHCLASEPRLRDLWKHLERREHELDAHCESCGGPCRDEGPL